MGALKTILDILANEPQARPRRRSLEDPSCSLSDPDEWLFDAFGAEKTASGIRVSLSTALKSGAVWRAGAIISGDVAKTPLKVLKRVGEGKQRDPAHPAYKLLDRKPNEETNATVFKQTLQFHALFKGNGYAYIGLDGAGRPLELLILDPDRVTPVRREGVLAYRVEIKTEARFLDPDHIFHLRGMGYDGLQGYGVLRLAREAIGLNLAASEFGARFFKNNAKPNLVLEHPAEMSPDAQKNFYRSWDERFNGLTNAHKTAILEEGMKAHELSISARDAQLADAMKSNLREIANFFGLPPHKLGDEWRGAYNSREQDNQAYFDGTLDFWFVQWESEANAKLLSTREQDEDTHTIEFVRQALLRADLQARAEYYWKATGGKPWMAPNEVRGLENMNPSDDPEADKLGVPLNMVPSGEQAKPKGTAPPAEDPPPAKDEGDEDEVRALLVDTATRAVKRLTGAVKKAAKKARSFEEAISDERAMTEKVLGPAARVCRVDAAALIKDIEANILAAARDATAGGGPVALVRLEAGLRTIEETLAPMLVGQLLEERNNA